jgi:hypothetical protein
LGTVEQPGPVRAGSRGSGKQLLDGTRGAAGADDERKVAHRQTPRPEMADEDEPMPELKGVLGDATSLEAGCDRAHQERGLATGAMMPEVKGVGAPDPKKVSVHFPALPTVPKGSAAVLEMAIPVWMRGKGHRWGGGPCIGDYVGLRSGINQRGRL